MRIFYLLFCCTLTACGTHVEIGNGEETAIKNASQSKAATNYYEIDKVSTLLRVAGAVGEEYINLSDNIATQQDITALLLLLTAAQGAYDVTTGASTERVARVGLFGLTLNQGAAYLRPAETSAALLRAAERQFCISGAGRRHALSTAQNDSVDFGHVADALTSVRLQLRRELSRGELPNYAELAAAYTQSLANAGGTIENPKSANLLDRQNDLKAALDRCLLVS